MTLQQWRRSTSRSMRGVCKARYVITNTLKWVRLSRERGEKSFDSYTRRLLSTNRKVYRVKTRRCVPTTSIEHYAHWPLQRTFRADSPFSAIGSMQQGSSFCVSPTQLETTSSPKISLVDSGLSRECSAATAYLQHSEHSGECTGYYTKDSQQGSSFT